MNNLSKIKGLGEKTIKNLSNINVNSIEELLTHYPYKYNLIKIDDLKEISEDTSIIIHAVVDSYPILRRFNGKMNSLNFRVVTNKKIVNVVIFNRSFLKNNLLPGKIITIYGKYEVLKNNVVASDIKLEKIEDGSIESIYHLTSGITKKNMKKYITNAFEYKNEIIDHIPSYLNEKYKFISKESALTKIHIPKNIKDIKDAKLKLIYEELFTFMFKINYLKKINKEENSEYLRHVNHGEIDDFIKTLPFELTGDQLKTVDDIYKDMTSSSRMNRIIQGDTGSGKTVVSVIAMYINYLSHYQSALMTPTEILAAQHYETIKKLLKSTKIKIELLVGSTKKSEKEIIYEKLKNGKIDLIIGTHALISENVEFKNLGLVITDEQHRFGVSQRANLKNKGLLPDTLYMSATPIPRTYALTIYGDMDISNIKTKPVGRKEIKTIVKSKSHINEVYDMILTEVDKGKQVFAVAPLIEESETLDLNTVNDIKTEMDKHFGKAINTVVLHGKLSKKEKESIMSSFQNGKIDVLISTTIIEVGVDIKNATMMVIFDAERFGLATLHQLRGRIGRNDFDSTCILIGSLSNKRLKVLSESNDGFYITEKDFEQRGEGDLFGVKQSGDMTFKIASIKRDFKILIQTKEDSNEFLKNNLKNDFKEYPLYAEITHNINKLD